MTGIRPAADADFDAVHELLDVRSRRLFGVSEISAEHLRQSWGRPAWVAEDGGRVVGYAALDEAHELEHIAPDEETADALLAEAVAAARAAGHDSVLLQTVPDDAATSALVRRHGFELDRAILRMWRDLSQPVPAPAWPDGIEVRTYRADDAPEVVALLDRAYGAWDATYVARPLPEWIAWMTGHDEFDPALWFLAERGGRPVACALHWRETHGRGWLKDLAVDARERGRGLGRALVLHGLAAYADRGVERVGLKVDSSNPTGAPELYARLGFEVDRRYELWRKAL
jgi:ribosomal protein S18 acetylase RimI-like enzyme